MDYLEHNYGEHNALIKIDKMIRMQGYIIVCSTNIHNSKDLVILSKTLASFYSVIDWTIDLSDSDKVLRVETSFDLTTILITAIEGLGFRCEIMGTFINNLCNH